MAVGGTWGKILHVDVTDGSTWVETPSDEVYLRLVGGRGLVAYLLLKHTPAGVDAAGPGERPHFCARRPAGQQPARRAAGTGWGRRAR